LPLPPRTLLSTGWRVYSRSVRKLLLFLASLALSSATALAQQNSQRGQNPQPLPVGVILSKVTALAKPEQSYALYLPSQYSPDKRWPIAYIFDPAARGNVPVELMKDAAEHNGYILAGSNNSRNGSWKIESEAAQTMLLDSEKRFTIDGNRVYFAGFSGGARVAASLANLCKCAAGILLNGAGFQPGPSTASEPPFAVFAAVGTYDFNYSEVVRMDDELEKLRYAHFMHIFEGPHQWAPASSMDEALSWFRLQAMKNSHESRDPSFAAAFVAQEKQRAQSFGQSGDTYFAWKEYRQAARAIAGLADDSSLRAKANALEQDKSVREAAKREKQDFDEQDLLTREISGELGALRESQANRAEIRSAVERRMAELHNRAELEKRPEKLRVLKRSIAAVMVQAVETGLERLDQNDPALARDYFELACEVDPDSAWAWSNLAESKALLGDRKGTLEALRRAKSKSKAPAQLLEWMKSEPAFAKLLGTPEFSAILETPAQH